MKRKKQRDQKKKKKKLVLEQFHKWIKVFRKKHSKRIPMRKI